MNKRYTFILASAMAGACMAQNGATLPARLQHADDSFQDRRPTAGLVGAQRDVVFSEDFANGFTGNNGIGEWTPTGTHAAMWRYSTTGPVGAYSVATQVIASPSVANGFMMFNGDSANTNFNADPPVIVGSPVEWDAALESPVLDLTSSPFVEIVFSQRFRWCCQATSPHAVEVSVDGGTTWAYTYPTNGIYNANDDSGTREIRINISNDIAGNAGSVKFRFKHNPTASHYHWQIDDVQVVELFPNNLSMNDGYLSHTGGGEEYGRIPDAQLLETMLVGGGITNSGSAAQTNVVINMSVTNSSGTEVFAASKNIPSLASGATDALEEFVTLPNPLPSDLYTATFTVDADEEDADLTDNTFVRTFEVADDIYTLDGIGNHPTGAQVLSSIGTNSFTDAEDGLVVMNYYQVAAPLTVHGIEFLTTTTTVVGGFVTVSLLDTVDVFADVVTNPISESAAWDITADDVANGRVRVFFPAPVELSPNGYYAAVTLFSNAGAGLIRILDDATVPQPNAATLIYIPGDQVYTNGNGMSIRLLLSPTVGVEETAALQGVSVFPNPSTGVVNVSTKEAGTHLLEVTNVLGAMVSNTTFAGSTTIDLSTLAKGVYNVRVSNANGSVIERVTIE
jgi:hypothetical protein